MALGRQAISLTVTGKIGPDQAVTSLALTTVTAINFRFTDGVVDISYEKNGNPLTMSLELSNLVTISFSTITKSGVLSTS